MIYLNGVKIPKPVSSATLTTTTGTTGNVDINPEYIFIQLTPSIFPVFVSTFFLCAILGATITCMDSQILVVATSLTEDIYKKKVEFEISNLKTNIAADNKLFKIPSKDDL